MCGAASYGCRLVACQQGLVSLGKARLDERIQHGQGWSELVRRGGVKPVSDGLKVRANVIHVERYAARWKRGSRIVIRREVCCLDRENDLHVGAVVAGQAIEV